MTDEWRWLLIQPVFSHQLIIMKAIQGEIKPNSMYRLDEPITRGCSSTWLERIIVLAGEIDYTEDYILVRNRDIVRMIQEGVIV